MENLSKTRTATIDATLAPGRAELRLCAHASRTQELRPWSPLLAVRGPLPTERLRGVAGQSPERLGRRGQRPGCLMRWIREPEIRHKPR